MPTNKQRRQAAQRRLQRQLERRGEIARKRRRNLLIGVTVVAVLAVVGAFFIITGLASSNKTSTSAAATTSAAASATPSAAAAAATATNPDGTVACNYIPDTSGNTNIKDVGTPPDAANTPTTGTSTLLMSTGQGDLTLTLDRATAPCAAASFSYLAQQKFFDGSSCHREVNQDNFGVLQCGDPSGTGQGGPSYQFGEEVTSTTSYPRGTIAMAKTSAPSSTGSQFFLCFTDTQLPPEYTVVGTVDAAGLAVLDTIAAAGNNGSNGTGDGAPNVPVTIKSITVVQ